MKDLTTFLVDYNTLRTTQPATPLLLAKVLVASSALQVLSFLCLNQTNHEDFISKTVKNIVALFNLPYFCKELGITLFLPLIVLLLLYIGSALLTLVSLFMSQKYKKLQDLCLLALCTLEHYTLNREVVFLFSLATGMETIFHPENYVLSASVKGSARKALKSLGIILIIMSLLHFYWQTYCQVSVSYNTESIRTEHRSGISKRLRGVLLTLISALAYTESQIGVFVCAGIYLLVELFILIALGNHLNMKINKFTLKVTILQVPIYAITLLTLWENIDILPSGMRSQRSLAILLITPFVGRIILNLERRRMRYVSARVANCFTHNSRNLSWLEMSQLDLFLRQMWSKFTNLEFHGPEIYEIIETIIRGKQTENQLFLRQTEDNLMEKVTDIDASKYLMKIALTPSFYDFVNSVYSSMLSFERKSAGVASTECYLSYVAFHKDITGNHGKAFIILARLQKILGTSASARTLASIRLVERDLQRQIAGSGTKKTISAEMLFSFLERSEKVQSSIENYVAEAFGFYERIQNPVINIKEIKNKGKKLLNERANIIKELDSLIKINEFHQQTLLLYEFFLSEIVEEKAEGRFFQIKNRIDIFNVAEFYFLYRQQKANETNELAAHGWDMSIEFFANQIDDSSDYAVIVFSLNPESSGRIMRCSTNLCALLGVEAKELYQMNISNIEVTLFNPQNLKTLQDKILKGEANLKDLAEEERTLYMKHENGSLIAYSFVADVEIYGRDPCITCYLRKKKTHEQEFVLFSLENQMKLIGMSDTIFRKVVKGSGSRFIEIARELSIIDMIPTLKPILVKAPVKPAWNESEALLIVPKISRKAISRAFYMINYSGRIQRVPLVDETIGIIDITYSERVTLQIQESKTDVGSFSSFPRTVTLHKIDSLNRNPSSQKKNQATFESQETKGVDLDENDDITAQMNGKVSSRKLLKMFLAARARQLSLQSIDTLRSPGLPKDQEPLKTEAVNLGSDLMEPDSAARLFDSLARNVLVQRTETENFSARIQKTEFDNLMTQVQRTELDNLNTQIQRTEYELLSSQQIQRTELDNINTQVQKTEYDNFNTQIQKTDYENFNTQIQRTEPENLNTQVMKTEAENQNSKAQRREFELVISSVRANKVRPKIKNSRNLGETNLDVNPGSSVSMEEWNKELEMQRDKYRQHGRLNKAARSEKITLGRASSVGSSIGAHMGFLRSIIIERKTPAVLNAVNLFGVISLASTVASMLVAYFVLADSYSTFTQFSQSAAFPSIMKAIAPSYTIAAETQFTVQYLPAAGRSLWQMVANFYAAYFYTISLTQNNQFIMNFDLPSLSEDILKVSIPANFSDLPQLNRNLNFYEVNAVFQTYTYKLSKYNYSSETIDPNILNFTREFLPVFNEMYEEMSNKNYQNIYDLYDRTNLTLDVIMVAGVIISIILMVAFIPIYWRYQKMEVVAFTKLCNITLKEMEPSLKKIVVSYEQLFGKTLSAMQSLQENVAYRKKKSKESFRSSSSSKNIKIKRSIRMQRSFTEKSSTLILVVLILFVSLLLSATYVVINIIFKDANAKILPFLVDLEKVSNGLPSCFTAQAAMTRIFNEVANPDINQTLPALIESYQESLNQSLSDLKDMNNHLMNALERAATTDILSDITKEFFRNLTDHTWCYMRFEDGATVYSYCSIGIKGVARTGFFATQNQIIDGFISQIKKFASKPTLATINEFYFSPDVFDFILMNLLAEYYMLEMLRYEQIDVGNYSATLHSQTRLMLVLGLLYNVALLFFLWVPTITYLRKRFVFARSIFLLVPTQVLLRNSGVNNLFKVW